MSENRAQQDRDAFEDGLVEAMKQAGEGFSPAGRPLVDGGVVRGRRRRVMRRGAMVSGSVAALALIGLGGSYVTGGIGASKDDGNKVAVGTRTKASGGSSAKNKVFGALEGLLPEAKLTEQGDGGSVPPEERAGASVVYDDGHGKAAVSVNLERQYPGQEPQEGDMVCPDKNLTQFESCSATSLDDGSRLVLFKGWEYPDRREETKWWYADLLTPEGYRISVYEWNAPAEKGEPVSRSTPPLSLDRLKTLVRSDAWLPILRTLPEPDEPPQAQPPQGMSGDKILSKLTAQLPGRLSVKASGKQETEYAYLVVDDGRGRSFVQINVQPGMEASDVSGADVKVLADGTRVSTRQGPGEKGGAGVVVSEVDTVRPDGLRVVISAFNSASQSEAATREAPALTLAELEKIATSEVWLSN